MANIPTGEDLSFDDPYVAIFDKSPGDTRRIGTEEPFASPLDSGTEWIGNTPSVNPQRPRTLAAGYDPNEQILTVVFRDGIWWNYYNVPQELWNLFKSSDSPGRFMNSYAGDDGRTLDSWGDMGRASFAGLTPQLKAYVKKLGVGGTWQRYKQAYKSRGSRAQR
jgi:hypothetical protein